MCRMFRQNQSARLDKPPDILRQTFNKETYNVSEADAFKGAKRLAYGSLLACCLILAVNDRFSILIAWIEF